MLDVAALGLAPGDVRRVDVPIEMDPLRFGGETYDAIVLTGSTPLLPESLVAQLKPGGRLFAVVGDAPVMEARLLRCIAPGSFQTIDLFETCLAPLANALQPRRFRF